MSNAEPMGTHAREVAYWRQSGGLWMRLTPRQWRRRDHKAAALLAQATGELPAHGASGVPVRKPYLRVITSPERGSYVTHVAYRCDSTCREHSRPRLHRSPR